LNNRLDANTGSCRVVAPSSREALRLVREKLGPEAIVLSNKVTSEGVEIVAALEGAIAAMSSAAAGRLPVPLASADLPAEPRSQPVFPEGHDDSNPILREIHSMRGMIEEQLAGMSWNEAQRRDPVRGHLLRTLLAAGFSARLAKDLLSGLPTGQGYASGLACVRSELENRLPVLQSEDTLMNEGGVYALMGPTGVGKTTTTAKLAARCVMRFGPEKLALVTTDSYRIGAYEQLRIYGQILGVSVHAVKDAVDLEGVLADLREKHMVLIDTVGMSQRDRAVSEQIAMLCSASRPVKRLLLLNASSHGDTLNEVVHAYRQGEQAAGARSLAGCIFTKVDEATHPGVLLDMAIRHRLPVHYISSGQKVPEHLVLADRKQIVDGVFAAKSRSALFVPGEADLDERPAALRNDTELLAAQTVSDRLRSQCQQLIQALTHNAHELTLNANALSSGKIGFDETRSLWRELNNDRAGPAGVAQDLQVQVAAEATASCSRHVLLLAGASEPGASAPAGQAHPGALLLSDRTGLPFGVLHELPGVPLLGSALEQRRLAKPFVHLLSRVPEHETLARWQVAGRLWAASAPATLRVIDVASNTSGTLKKLAAVPEFGMAQEMLFRGKPALMSVAEMRILPARGLKCGSGTRAEEALPLRCVIRRVVEAGSGKLLAQSYLLLSPGIEATAPEAAQWAGWRSAAEVHFRFLGQALAQLAEAGPSGDAVLMKRLLVVSQACTTVLRLQRSAQPWARGAREVLGQLAGRTARSGRAIPLLVLMEGLGKFLVLLDALDHDAAASSLPAHPALAAQA
jgi:flagellar biosynthesis protein FlhF